MCECGSLGVWECEENIDNVISLTLQTFVLNNISKCTHTSHFVLSSTHRSSPITPFHLSRGGGLDPQRFGGII